MSKSATVARIHLLGAGLPGRAVASNVAKLCTAVEGVSGDGSNGTCGSSSTGAVTAWLSSSSSVEGAEAGGVAPITSPSSVTKDVVTESLPLHSPRREPHRYHEPRYQAGPDGVRRTRP